MNKKPIFNKKRIEKILHKVFLNSKITACTELGGGLVHSIFKVLISNPERKVVVRISKAKNVELITKNNKILSYLSSQGIRAPKFFLQTTAAKQIITCMEFLDGHTAEVAYKHASSHQKKLILTNVGKILRHIHLLKIPVFWKHNKHEIISKWAWFSWTNDRIKKYLLFSQKYLKSYYPFLKKELSDFEVLLNKQSKQITFVPLHWDYHLGNVNVDKNGCVTGVFDFDASMKGHHLADIGQTKYWIRFRTKDPKNFPYFLKGYQRKTTETEQKLIHGYFLLHLLAVTRSIWKRRKLAWIIREHKLILDELMSQHTTF